MLILYCSHCTEEVDFMVVTSLTHDLHIFSYCQYINLMHAIAVYISSTKSLNSLFSDPQLSMQNLILELSWCWWAKSSELLCAAVSFPELIRLKLIS